jgi:hypothetical protein
MALKREYATYLTHKSALHAATRAIVEGEG